MEYYDNVTFSFNETIIIDNYYSANSDEPSSHHRARDFFILFYSPILVFLGLIGNSLLVTIFMSTKLKKISSSFYLAAIGISDSLILVDIAIEWI